MVLDKVGKLKGHLPCLDYCRSQSFLHTSICPAEWRVWWIR